MYRVSCALLLLALAAAPPAAEAAKRKLTVDVETAEGALLKKATDEADPAARTALFEEFVSKHGGHESATWVYGELQGAYLKAGDFAKAMAAGDKVLAADPDDLAIASQTLKAAEGAKDAAAIKKYAYASSAAAKRVAAAPKPAEADQEEHWKATAAYAKEIGAYSAYAVYAAALATPDAAQRVEMGEWLIKEHPESQYTAGYRPQLFVAYQQAGMQDKALAFAEQELAGAHADNDDMLVFAATKAYEAKNKAKVEQHAGKLIAVLPAKPAPEGVAAETWTQNKNLKLGLAYWMLGVTASNEQRWADADKQLRSALPLLSGNKDLAAETLFHLGLANYRLGDAAKGDKNRIIDALKFNQQCAALASPFQAQAKKNVAAIRTQYRIR